MYFVRTTAVAALLGLTGSHCSQSDNAAPAPPAPVSAEASSPPTSASDASVASAPRTPFERELDALDGITSVRQGAMSADGAKLAWVEASVPPGSDRSTSCVRVLDRKDPAAKPRTISAGAAAKREHGVAVSRDGKTLAFLSDAVGNKTQLYVVNLDDAAGAPRALTDLTGVLDEPTFTPDGKTIAVAFTEGAKRVGPLEAVSPVQGEAEASVSVRRVLLVDVATGQSHPLTRADLYVHEHVWSPDGAHLAIIASPPPGDRHWWVAKLYVVDARTGEERLVYAPPKQIAGPVWSPDGASIAFIGGLMSDEGSTGGDVFVVAADGSTPARDVTPAFHGSAESLAWPTGDRIIFSAAVDGASAIDSVAATSRPDKPAKLESLWSGADEGVDLLAVSADGAVSLVTRASFSKPREVSAGAVGKWQQVTHANDGLQPMWGDARSVTWTSEGRDVQGWLLAPRALDPKKRAPLVVMIHGGPAAAMRPTFGATDALASQGYFLFFPNARGSFGQGEAFTTANVKDFGGGDMRDILAGIDEVVRTAPVDASRVGLTGWSYGGFMTMWMVTQTTRFRAAVAGAGIANWQSYWGENAIGDWMIPYFGASVYDDPKVYARSSPIEFIKHAKTPTLLLVGENDGECPAPQSFEFWRGLQAQGVETKLVVYPGEGHALRKAENRRDRTLRTLKWFDAHL